MTDDELDARLADAGARWRERNAVAASIDIHAVANAAAEAAPEAEIADTGTQALPLIPDAPAPKHRRRTRILLAASAAVVAAVVASVLAVQLGGNSSNGNSPAAQGGTPLTGTEWQLAATSKAGAATGVNATLHLTDSGELSGNDGCNAFGGHVSISTDGMTLGRIVHTMMGCLGANGSVGQAVDAVLSGGSVQYAINGDTLTITKSGTGTLTYIAQPRQPVTPATTDPAAIVGPDWVLNTVQLGDNIARSYGTASSAPTDAQVKFAGNELVGIDGCNSFRATVDIGSGTLAVADFADTTANPCPNGSSDWTLVLKGATHWTLVGDQLTITDAHNGKLVFTKVPGIAGTPTSMATGTSSSTASK